MWSFNVPLRRGGRKLPGENQRWVCFVVCMFGCFGPQPLYPISINLGYGRLLAVLPTIHHSDGGA